MQVTLETTTGLERRMRISVPAERLETQVDEKLRQTARQVRLKGFRPGKVPMKEVKRRFGDGIRQEVSSELIQSSFSEAISERSVSPAGTPQIEDVRIEPGKDLEFTAVFEVFPEVSPGDFGAIEVERPVAEVTDSDIDEMITRLRQQRTEFAETDRAAAAEDQVNLDFEGFVDGEAFEGNKAEGADIVIGSGRMIPGFEDGLKGLSAGDEKDIDVTFPDDYQVDDLAGKAAVFKVRVNRVSESVEPELNDEFFKQFGVEEGGMEAFREEVRSNMGRELENAVLNKVKTQVMDGLLAVTEVQVPRALVSSDIDRLRRDAITQFGGGAQLDPSMLPAEMFEKQATRRVSLGLILNAVVEKTDLQVDDDLVRAKIEKMASSYDEPEQVVNFYYSNEQQLAQIRNMVLEEQVVGLILDQAKVTDVTMKYADAVKPPETEADDEADADADADGSAGS
ncbi:MAG: trigger factor [Proteobacteria bacterium]|nr:trigger factor [Pseudomonadota bacterium]MDA1299304.1 trigger factor [Pseudomonadota bacterium]